MLIKCKIWSFFLAIETVSQVDIILLSQWCTTSIFFVPSMTCKMISSSTSAVLTLPVVFPNFYNLHPGNLKTEYKVAAKTRNRLHNFSMFLLFIVLLNDPWKCQQFVTQTLSRDSKSPLNWLSKHQGTVQTLSYPPAAPVYGRMHIFPDLLLLSLDMFPNTIVKLLSTSP